MKEIWKAFQKKICFNNSVPLLSENVYLLHGIVRKRFFLHLYSLIECMGVYLYLNKGNGREGMCTFLWDHPDENQSEHGQRNQ